MQQKTKLLVRSTLLMAAFLVSLSIQAQNVVQPGDPIIASSPNSPGSEGVANAIDGKPTKYLNFDSGSGKPSGFVVTPSVGATRITGITMQSANDGPERDPKTVTIEGSNDTITNYTSGNWEMITTVSNIPSWITTFGTAAADNRFKSQTFSFANLKAYKSYRFVVTETQGPNNTCCFQIAEVQLLGSVLPKSVVQAGDPIIASSPNSPGSEGVANAIDGKPTKYLNFDSGSGKPSGFVVTPSVGRTVVSGITLQSANDGPERDPKKITIEGTDDTVTNYTGGNWTLVTTIADIPAWTTVFGTAAADNRFKTQTFLFDNVRPFKSYRFVVVETQGPNNTCCFQIAEVGLLGTGEPKNVAQPGDPVIASSPNSPGSEGVANAIDGKPTKYLNFDSGSGKPSGLIVTPSVGATTITGISMQSANDGPERDPKKVLIEGSNDNITNYTSGTWETITTLADIPAWTTVFGTAAADNRFKTQTFYFNNSKSYKSYRFTVQETQGPNNTCCFQIAEIGFLAVTSQTDCSKARFITQPLDTPVLEGSSAKFVAAVNGPWPLQWFKNGVAISGANSPTYTTDPVTAANATNTYSVQIVGCEMSTVVRATIFKPATVKSIGINFIGSGANGTPTSMNADDIAGVQPQAYWNNETGGTGSASDLVDSDNSPSTITFDWSTSGQWGAGTGDQTGTQRMLNGLVYANPGTIGSLNFGNVPAGKHAVMLYLVGIPLQFQNAVYRVIGKTSQTNYVRVINADEYNPAPGFYRATSKDPKVFSLATLVRFDNVEALNGVITVEYECLTTGFDRGVPINAAQLVLNAPDPGNPPVIVSDPQPTVAPTNGTVRLSVTATGAGLTYQWRKDGKNITDGGNISGAKTSTLTISSFNSANEGLYTVAVFNQAGSVISRIAAARLSAYDINESLVAWWKLDETSGKTGANAVAGGQPIKIEGNAIWGAGKINNGLTLDGTTYATVTNYTKAKRQLSASMWVKADPSLGDNVVFIRNAQGDLRISTSGNIAVAGQFEFGLRLDQNDGLLHLSAAIEDGPNINRVIEPGAFPTGTWQQVGFSADGAQLRLYHNGVEVNANDYAADINTPDITWLSVGGRVEKDVDGNLGLDAISPWLMVGSFDDIAIWNRGLTAEEMNQIYTLGNAGKNLGNVKLTAPPIDVTPGKLTVSVAAGKVTIGWDKGKLQSSTDLKTWADVAGVTGNTYSETPSGKKFFRTIQ